MVDVVETATGRLGNHQPFPGLSPFEIDEAAWFFGRGRQTFDVLNRLREIRWIAVVGPSGCGKSSLIKAGVLAPLEQGYLGGDWCIVSTRPADAPMSNLVSALEARLPHVANIGGELRSGALGLVSVARQARMPANGRLLILVDQFEELFQFVRRAEEQAVAARRRGDAAREELTAGALAQEEAKAFLKLLLRAALSEEAPVYIVITMRSEWLGYCAAYRGLAEAINEGLYLVPEMTRSELRKAIVQPIVQAGGAIVSPLVDRMLNDLDGRTDQLPVLQHALMLMWRGRVPGQPLSVRDYDAVGGFAECLSRHAGAVYNGLSKDQQKAAGIVFKAVTEVTPDNRKVRRQSTAEAIACKGGIELEKIRDVLTVFSGEETGFLVVSPLPVSGRSIVDISHEALIRQWDTLKQWVEEESASRRAVEQLERDAEVWTRHGIRGHDYLYVGDHLRDAEGLRSRPDFVPAPATVKFLAASRAGEERRARHRAMRLWGCAVAAVLVIALSVESYVKKQVDSASRESGIAEWEAQKVKLDARTKAAEAAEQERDRLAAIVRQVCKDSRGKAGEVCAEMSRQTIRPKTPLAPHVYMLIGGEAQLPEAQECAKLLSARGYAVQESVERLARVPGVTSVRYFHLRESERAAAIAKTLANCRLPGVKAALIKNFESAPAGQFEIWFSPNTLPQN
jgi:hypothetical protein